MKREDIIRAWRDPEFRQGLSAEERASLPESPAGQAFTELDEVALERAVGGAGLAASFDDVACICSVQTSTIRTTLTKTTTRTVVSIDPRVNVNVLQLDQVAGFNR